MSNDKEIRLTAKDFLQNAEEYLEIKEHTLNVYIRDYGERRLRHGFGMSIDYSRCVFKTFCHCITMLQAD